MKVLVIAPHPDDEILGCGGVMARHIARGDEVYVCIATSSRVEKARQLNEMYARRAHEAMGVRDTFFLDFPPVELPHADIRAFNGAVANVVNTVAPDTVYIPFYGDMHADHAAVSSAAMVALRPLSAPFVRDIYMYETLSETGWNYPSADKAFIPNVFCDITDFIDAKINAMNIYETKVIADPHPRSPEGLRALAKFRGGTVGKYYAEAFMCVRHVD